MNTTPREQAIAFLQRSQKILIVAPQKWHEDEIAGMLALQNVLLQAGKEAIAIAPNDIPKNLTFLGGAEKLSKDLGEQSDFVISIATNKASVDKVKYNMKEDSVDILVSPKNGFFSPSDVSFLQSAGKFDVIVTLGMESLEKAGKVFNANTQLFASTPIMNISVSAGNDFFGTVNLVDPSRSSVCELLLELIEKTEELSLDGKQATMLLTGIVGRTGSFQEPVTTANAFEASAKLQGMGAKQSEIIEHLFKMKSFSTLKIWGRILSNYEVDPVHRIGWSSIVKADFELAEAKPQDVENMVDELLRHTKGTELAVLFIEEKGKTVIQVRSAQPNINFRELQASLGGGGELVPNGLNFEIAKKGVAEVQFEFLKLILHSQKERLHIPQEVEMQKVELTETVHPAQTSFAMLEDKDQPAVSPTPPAHVPFEAPEQLHENAPGKSDMPSTQSAEVTLDPNNKKIPDWLKQSFPK
jgi:bifunctional oligoribonuclease and PAP phosphatase NrnA